MRQKIMSLLPPSECLPGRDAAPLTGGIHAVSGRSIYGPFPENHAVVVFGMGCFWGAERLFWQLPGVYVTAAGYAGGVTPNPTYEEVCSGLTNHTEVVLVVYNKHETDLETLLEVFWQEHNPTQFMHQGNDRGTQYRSAIYVSSESDLVSIEASKNRYQLALDDAGFEKIETEIGLLDKFYYAEEYHQQYLQKVPNGYCGLAGTGVCLEKKFG